MNDISCSERRTQLGNGPLLPQLSEYLHWAGIYEPTKKIYLSLQNLDLPYISHFIFLFVIANLNKLIYNKLIGGLTARRPQDNLDGMPFVTGLTSLLRHIGSANSQTCCSLLIQFVRSHMEANAKYGIKPCI